MLAKNLAALAEVLLVLALGNIIGEAIYPYLASESVLQGSASDIIVAFHEGLLILLRLGTVALLGLLLLYLRKGLTPEQTGLTRNDHALGLLVKEGLAMGLLSGFLLSLLFSIQAVSPLGEGLAAWWTYSDTPINSAFWVMLLGTSVFIPPLTEEIMTRAYMRVRVSESFGPMAGVVLTGLIFGLSHSRYISADPMLFLFLVQLLFASILWTYSAQKYGSIIPALIAHSLSNGIGTAILFNVWLPLATTSVLCLLLNKRIRRLFSDFLHDWKEDKSKIQIWQGLIIIVLVLIISLALLNSLGRSMTLAILGMACLTYTLVFTAWEIKRSKT